MQMVPAYPESHLLHKTQLLHQKNISHLLRTTYLSESHLTHPRRAVEMNWLNTVWFLSAMGIAWGYGNRQEDLINDLPGAPDNLPFLQFSGYLDGLKSRKLHYWLVQSEGRVSRDPLVVWFNGGPGCSSLTGLLEENGPFKVAEDGRTLITNPYRWNRVVSMLYIESPVGTGFSYATDGNYITNDIDTRDNNYAALKSFFRRHTGLKANEMYIFGQSYGGVYVPMLAAAVIDDKDINFKGFAVGNGALDSEHILGSLPYFLYTRDLLTETKWSEWQKACCTQSGSGSADDVLCDFNNCNGGQYFYEALGIASTNGVNAYDVTAPCSTGVDEPRVDKDAPLRERAIAMGYQCVNSTATIVYLNQASVRRALHIPDSLPGMDEWYMCGYTSEYSFDVTQIDMASYVKRVVKSGARALLYFGTSDILVNFMGGRWFAESLNLTEISPERRWFYQDEHGLQQIGGTIVRYDRLDYISVKGGSHMVPKSSPRQAYQMFKGFLEGKWPTDE